MYLLASEQKQKELILFSSLNPLTLYIYEDQRICTRALNGHVLLRSESIVAYLSQQFIL